MTEQEVRNLAQTDPLPETREGKQKVYEHVYHSIYSFPTKEAARKKLKMVKQQRKSRIQGYYCPGGKHAGVYKQYGGWYAYLHFAQYE